jgi:hypothetical protein
MLAAEITYKKQMLGRLIVNGTQVTFQQWQPQMQMAVAAAKKAFAENPEGADFSETLLGLQKLIQKNIDDAGADFPTERDAAKAAVATLPKGITATSFRAY